VFFTRSGSPRDLCGGHADGPSYAGAAVILFQSGIDDKNGFIFIEPGFQEDTLCQETSGIEHHRLRASANGIAITNLLVE
jgi:hypothetical protein